MRKIKPSKELLLKHMYQRIVEFQGDSDVEQYTLAYTIIPSDKHIQYNPNPYGSNMNEIVCFSIKENEWVTIDIKSGKEFLGVKKDLFS